jgi:hypothetical protein
MRAPYIAIVLLAGLLALPIYAIADEPYENRGRSAVQNLSAGDPGPEQNAVPPVTVTEARRRELMRRLQELISDLKGQAVEVGCMEG